MTSDDERDLPFDDDTIPLHGVSLPVSTEASPVESESTPDDESPTLLLRPLDDAIPGRDFQPRLFRFGEAA